MADDGSTRTRRWQHHKAGDHHLCRPGCQERRAPVRIAPVPSGSGENLEPAAALRDLAARLVAAHEADPSNAVLARELRATLLVLLPSRDGGVDAEMKLLMDTLSRPVGRDENGDWLD